MWDVLCHVTCDTRRGWPLEAAAGSVSPWEREGGEAGGDRLRQSQTKLTIEGGGHCMLLSPVARSPGTVRLGPPSPPDRP